MEVAGKNLIIMIAVIIIIAIIIVTISIKFMSKKCQPIILMAVFTRVRSKQDI